MGEPVNQVFFDNRTESIRPIALQLKDVESYEDGAVWLRYLVK